ncbi:MAG: PD40 domain-containing protein [Acidobacteria bacterium]|nr:PD40 domain-containing protein [Acidobacteriota bacterium]
MPNVSNKFYEFSSFQLNAKERFLLRNGERIPLTPKAFDTLLILVERHGHIVEKNDLMKMVWPDAIVEENNLNQNISTIRKALGETSHSGQFIETLPRRGYRFIAEVKEVMVEDPKPTIAAPAVIASDLPQRIIPKPNVWPRISVSLVLLVTLTGIFYFVNAKRGASSSIARSTTFKLNRLSSTYGAWETAISPDGKQVAYIIGDVRNQSLRLKQMDTGAEIELLAHETGRFRGLTFSPDGKSLYYSQMEKSTSKHALFRKPIQGGEAKRLMSGVDSAVTFSPDGKRIAFVRDLKETGESWLILASADGGEEQPIASQKKPDYFTIEGPSWSPDGRLIAVAVAHPSPVFRFQIVTINVATHEVTAIPDHKLIWASKVAWLPDMSGIALIGRSEKNVTQNDQLWIIDYPQGELNRVVTDLHTYRGISMDKSGTALLTIRSETRSDIWILPESDSRRAQIITSDPASQLGGNGIAWTFDGQLIYTSLASGHKDLWIMRADGSHARPLTTDPQDNVEAPSITADGQYVVFNAGRNGVPRIWRIGLDGKDPVELTHGKMDLQSFSSPVEKFIYFSQDVRGKRIVSRVKVEGGEPQPLTDKVTEYPTVSPDGKWIACFYQATPGMPQQVAVLPAEGGPPKYVLDVPAISDSSLRWHPDGQSITFLIRDDGTMNIWRKPISGGAPEKITDFKTDRIFSYAWSRDGRTLACARGAVHRDVVMINELAP